ncbi:MULTISPECIES: M23 family metallopeptidase [unclassified Luteimonas]|uniref:M23 family metallopeptidase n=1 Tax=unclassified Luteimonas TaxID=2629088 RepID=UPI0016047613|nr:MULTISPECIES: M23 family metallopeptidase [unclassified Luteimonas]MBB1473016.1 M23 family metallopeptidase [Luteimonas sp. MC1782]MBB6598283.1 M23 family metallopeptidase [Luteimonas sp. MC1825]QOC88496.1 M23 family metallopeptidase [Luteimonas sp. MC1825]
MRYVAMVLAGLLLAAVVHLAGMSRAERARILRITPAPEAGAEDRAGPVDRGPSRATRRHTTQPPSPPGRPVAIATRPRTALPLPLPSGLVLPVQGVVPAQLSPTFEDARSEGRVHEAIDIMAPTGTPVLAVADGHVEKLFDSAQGGLTIYQFEPGGRFAYYYAHLDGYAPGLAEKQQVRQGQVIGYVGSTGNADPAGPHLHFAIFVLGPEKQWWKGTPIDPFPLFTGKAP